jgi:hypothetical protein
MAEPVIVRLPVCAVNVSGMPTYNPDVLPVKNVPPLVPVMLA